MATADHMQTELEPLSEASRWQDVRDKHIDIIQAVERSIEQELFDHT